jgi:fructan beta-fructosidase
MGTGRSRAGTRRQGTASRRRRADRRNVTRNGADRRRILVVVAAALAACVAIIAPAAPSLAQQGSGEVRAKVTATPVTYREAYRPQFHFTPARNWMNDPNGLVYYRGVYHLFYQYNPVGSTWGEISWGHAVSRDLVHWRELGVAIPADETNYIFSGSIVVDENNTSGFGTSAHPAMVAIYTSAARECCHQRQALAYSTGQGRTWTKYAGNPVLDIGSGEFRDPKVFWYAPDRRWVMAVVLATEHKVSFYGSPNLKSWTHLSDFGPANAVGGVWEVPDLFPLHVDGDRHRTKWVLVVNINPGGIAGGSGAQYFVGRFNGTTFRADNVVGSYAPPAGTLFEGFEGARYGRWTTTGTAFGTGPAPGDLPGQQGVSGFVGRGLANSFTGGDTGQGSLTSRPFTVTRPYVNFLVGGGTHPHDPATVEGPPPPGDVLADFEGGTYGAGWTASGTFAGTTPPAGAIGDQQPVSGYEGQHLVNTFIDHDNGTGTITSPDLTISKDHLNLLVGGGDHPYPGSADNPPTAVNLVVDGQVVDTATGQDSEQLNWVSWDVAALRGRTAHIEVVDRNTGGWGHVLVDQITLADQAARPGSVETAVNLLVGGKVVRSVTGRNSEMLDWASFDVRDLIGRTARLQVLDNNNGGFGHILLDQVMFARAPARSVEERSNWLDYGKDYYAAVSYNNLPPDQRTMIGWMNNWQYAGSIPTAPWRSAMSVPRRVELRTIDGQVRVVQRPVRQLNRLRTSPVYRLDDRTVRAGSWTLDRRRASGRALDIVATFDVRTADRFGLKVRTGNGEQTVIGYDVGASELYVDRTRSGDVSFSRDFPGVQRAPLAATRGRVQLRILVDWSSVEVFAGQGRRVITDQIFPSGRSRGVQLFAEGGRVHVDAMRIWHMRSIWPGGAATP